MGIPTRFGLFRDKIGIQESSDLACLHSKPHWKIIATWLRNLCFPRKVRLFGWPLKRVWCIVQPGYPEAKSKHPHGPIQETSPLPPKGQFALFNGSQKDESKPADFREKSLVCPRKASPDVRCGCVFEPTNSSFCNFRLKRPCLFGSPFTHPPKDVVHCGL